MNCQARRDEATTSHDSMIELCLSGDREFLIDTNKLVTSFPIENEY